MAVTVSLSVDIDAPVAKTWAAIADISSHIEWMHDALEIRFAGTKRSGVGTAFECVTQIGKIRLTDEMMVREWVDEERLGVSHHGVVSGTGVFVLRQRDSGGTELTWDEQLSFPWFLGGPLGEFIAKPIFKRIWTRNLAALKARVENAR